eukprot:Skav228150  [mRNA]  locus=scaffold2683:212436:213142:- [translate_table: standard]
MLEEKVQNLEQALAHWPHKRGGKEVLAKLPGVLGINRSEHDIICFDQRRANDPEHGAAAPAPDLLDMSDPAPAAPAAAPAAQLSDLDLLGAPPAPATSSLPQDAAAWKDGTCGALVDELMADW